MPQTTVRTILHEAAKRLTPSSTARQDAELLLMRAAGQDKAWLLTHSESELSPEQVARFEGWVARRARQEPVQYILGETEFFGLTFRVTPDVLIPRPETEHLVEAAIERLGMLAAPRIADVGTGSGAIGEALAHALPHAEVTALDISAAALAVARKNAEGHGVAGRMRFLESDLLEAVRGERFDAVVSNPPYVADSEVLEAQVAEYEPHTALFAGPTGLEVYRRLIPQAGSALAPGGWLLMEIGHGQRESLAELLSARRTGTAPAEGSRSVWEAVEFIADLQGIPRVAIARHGTGQ